MWANLDKRNYDSVHYSIIKKMSGVDGMKALYSMFPEGKADELNFVLFSTSGVHGTYNTIEEAEKCINGENDKEGEEYIEQVTFLIVHPRLVALRYGNCEPKNIEDIEFLKTLRQSSLDAVKGIGEFVIPPHKTARPNEQED